MPAQFAIGTYAEAQAQIGTLETTFVSCGPVNEAMIRYFASASEDANPGYWDDAFARRQWGGAISPPSMLMHWVVPPPWSPGAASGGDLAPPLLMTRVPLPGDTLINISVDYTYRRPVRVGERLVMTEKLVAVSPEKRTRLGLGHFVTTDATFTSGEDEIVATAQNIAFRFRAVDE